MAEVKFQLQPLYPSPTNEPKWHALRPDDAESLSSGGRMIGVVNGRLVAFPSSGSGITVDWSDITGKPTAFPPETHSHSDYLTQTEIQALIDASLSGNTMGFDFDAFGRARVSHPVTLAEHGFEYDLRPNFIVPKTVGTGTVTHDGNKRSAILSVAAVAADRAAIQQYRYNFYEKGKSQRIKATGVFGAAVADVVKRIGYFDDNNGVWLEQNGTSGWRIVLRSSVSGAIVDTAVNQTSWRDENGAATAGATLVIDPTKQQIIDIHAQFLGAGLVTVRLNIDGQSVKLHCFRNANISANAPYMQTFTLPVRYEIVQGGTTGAATLQAICFEVESEGGSFQPSSNQFAVTSPSAVTAASGTLTPIIAIRPKATLGGFVNRIPIIARACELLAGSNPVKLTMVFNGTLTVGGAWTSADAASGVEYNANVTGIAGGIQFHQGFAESSKKAAGDILANLDTAYPLGLDVDGLNPTNMCLCATGIGGTSACYGALTWDELR